jgi:FMN phosphatase YigB (HAD superfamily)
LTLPPESGRDQLGKARQLIELGAVSTLSLDMFDTVVWRTVPRPADAFVLLGQTLLEDGILSSGLDPHSFRRLRIEAETLARVDKEALGGGSEVTLEEIWAQFPDYLLLESRRAMAGRELELERRITVPDLDIADLVAFAQEQGIHLVVVSNTYFSRQQLIHLLARPGLEPLVDARIYASSAYGVNKSNGLWKVVLEDLGVPASRVVHVGDEQSSDVDVPLQHGMRVAPFYRFFPGMAPALVREGTLMQEPSGPIGANVDPRRGDFGITGIRAKVAARVESSDLPADLAGAWRYGATVLGPVLTGFAEWVHQQALEIGSGRVWCLMREGELLADLVNTVATSQASGLEAVPVWLSRHVTGLAAVNEVNESFLRSLADRRLAPTFTQYLSNLGLSEGEVPELRHLAGRRMDAPGVAEGAVAFLLGSAHLRSRILEESGAARRRLINYLKRTMGALEGPIVLVDLGWGGTIQHQLRRVFQLSGIDARTVGLYMSTNAVACARMLEGTEMHGYLTSCGVPDFDVNQVSRSPEVVEQVCVASTGSVLDFDDEGEPILDSSIPAPDQVIDKVFAQHGIRAFQREWLRYERSVAGWLPLDGAERHLLLRILRTSITEPSAEEVRVFGSWQHDDNFGTAHSDTVVPAELGAFVPYLTPLDVLAMNMQDAYWPMGLTAQFDPPLTAAANAVLDGRIPASVFEPSRTEVTARLFVDSGAGFGATVEQRLRVNRNGLTYLHFSVKQPAMSAIRLELSDQPAVFRIDWIDLELEVEGHSQPSRFRLEGEAELGGLVYQNCHWLYDGVAVGLGGPPSIDIPLAGRAGGLVYRLDLRFAGALLALPAPSHPVALGSDPSNSLARVVSRARIEAARGGPKAVAKGALRMVRRSLQA